MFNVKVEVVTYFSPEDMNVHVQATASAVLDKTYYASAEDVVFSGDVDTLLEKVTRQVSNEARRKLASFVYAGMMDE